MGGNILLKANLLAPVRPESAVTTHPRVLEALVEWSMEKSPSSAVIISDSPGYLFSGQWPLFIANCGLETIRKNCGCTISPLNDEGFVESKAKNLFMLNGLRIPAKVSRMETVLNVAKLKTHVETEITCCLKNTFGYLDTATRKRAHRSGSLRSLCNAILDAHVSRMPDWNILDAVIGMEGNGPSHGDPRPTGWIIASRNALAVDFVAATIMGYENPFSIPLLSEAAKRGLGPVEKENIELRGAEWRDLPVPGFRKAPTALRRFVPTPLRGFAHSFVRLSPSWNSTNCTFCGACSAVCPVGAIQQVGEKVRIRRSLCVRCLCCNEMCPTGAMGVKQGFLARVLLSGRKTKSP
jgi:uncharacterized protein (DUF362 family)/Pyruvate/2-oxoacid:ferredoxin oxidoreductase delta subunit